MSSPSLGEALPDLVRDLEGALVRIGRGKVADQLTEASLLRWEYDEMADVAYLYLSHPGSHAGPGQRDNPGGEMISLYDELGTNVDLDERGRLAGIEVLGAAQILPRLKEVAP